MDFQLLLDAKPEQFHPVIADVHAPYEEQTLPVLWALGDPDNRGMTRIALSDEQQAQVHDLLGQGAAFLRALTGLDVRTHHPDVWMVERGSPIYELMTPAWCGAAHPPLRDLIVLREGDQAHPRDMAGQILHEQTHSLFAHAADAQPDAYASPLRSGFDELVVEFVCEALIYQALKTGGRTIDRAGVTQAARKPVAGAQTFRLMEALDPERRRDTRKLAFYAAQLNRQVLTCRDDRQAARLLDRVCRSQRGVDGWTALTAV